MLAALRRYAAPVQRRMAHDCRPRAAFCETVDRLHGEALRYVVDFLVRHAMDPDRRVVDHAKNRVHVERLVLTDESLVRCALEHDGSVLFVFGSYRHHGPPGLSGQEGDFAKRHHRALPVKNGLGQFRQHEGNSRLPF